MKIIDEVLELDKTANYKLCPPSVLPIALAAPKLARILKTIILALEELDKLSKEIPKFANGEADTYKLAFQKARLLVGIDILLDIIKDRLDENN